MSPREPLTSFFGSRKLATVRDPRYDQLTPTL